MKRVALLVAGLCAFAAVHAAEDTTAGVPRSKEYNWMSIATWNKKHDSHKARAKQGGVNLLFLGDSITEGWAGAQSVFDTNYKQYNAANFGIGGDMTQNVLWRIQNGALEGIQPKAVVLMIGTNNFGLDSATPEDVAKGVAKIIETLQQKIPNVKVLLLGIFPRDAKPDTPNRKRIAATNELLAKQGNGASVQYLDIGPKFLAADGTISKEIMNDALHLTKKGYEIWADAIREPVAALMK